MANQQAFSVGGNVDQDLAEHENTYRRFIGLIKIAVVCVIVILIILAVTTL